MPIIARGSSSSYTPCPAGLHHAVCVDVEDLGVEVSDKFKDKNGKPVEAHKIRIVWQIDEPRMESGARFLTSRFFTLSLNEKAKLRPFLESWRGRPFTQDDLKNGFDVEKLIGVNCTLQVLLGDDGERTYVANIMPPVKGAELIQPENYTRKQDRDDEPKLVNGFVTPTPKKEAPAKAKAKAAPADDDVEVPF